MNPTLRDALHGCRGAFLAVVAFSAVVNLLMLTAPLYMLQVFDRVLTSRSTDTLLALTLIAAVALAALAALEAVRNLAGVSINNWLDTKLSAHTLRACIVGASRRPSRAASTQPLSDLTTLRNFLGSASIFPVMDVPWTPLFIGIIFMLHPLLGSMALAGAIVLLTLALANELLTRKPLEQASACHQVAMQRADACARNADVVEAMGMLDGLVQRWQQPHADAVKLQASATARSAGITSTSKFIRLALQSGMLGVGAWLVIGNELTPGGMVASTILLGRALAPVDQAINSWKSLVAARAAYGSLRDYLATESVPVSSMSLPRPAGILSCEGVTFGHDPNGKPTLSQINFELPAGKTLGLVGPMAVGKTTLARMLVGNLKPRLGCVRLDGMDLSEWPADDRGQYIGYLPQDIELFQGTVRDNIARMGEADDQKVVAAAQRADVHELIMRLPQGYETILGEGAMTLSRGQRQRVALARALYGDPCLVVLDEPNSNLDEEGNAALRRSILGLQQHGTTVVVIAHQPGLVELADYLVVLGDGTVKLSGPCAQVLAQVTAPMSVVSRHA